LYGSYGAVIDLATGMTKMTFGRGWNDVGICKFPVAFCTACDGSPLLVHSSAWNRLDISDANSGRLLTERTPIPWSANGPAREHDLNFFHCQLLISPDQTWIAEDGLCYPYKQGKDATGIPRIWNLQKWLHENVFESEDGSSIRTVGSRYELWDSPMCWINDQTLAVYGVDIEQLGGGNDPLVIDGVSILDAVAGKEISCFPGPIIGQQLHYDQVLIAFGAEAGTSVWDVKTGNRLWHDTALKPAAYHAGARQFVTQICAGEFEIARLSGI
jgi:hypothetical protein